MAFEPKNFFIGIIDFFSVILPGAVLTQILFKISESANGDLTIHALLQKPDSWVIFLFSSYLLGHFVFLIGSITLDFVYDHVRNVTVYGQIRRLAKGKSFTNKLIRWSFRRIFKGSEAPLLKSLRIKYHFLQAIDAAPKEYINAFQWCKARLTLENPEAIAVVNRFEADSKFFRSLVIVLLALLVYFSVHLNETGIAVTLLLTCFAFFRFAEQRNKAVRQTYWFLITSEGANKEIMESKPDPPFGITHAGGLVMRENGDFLLVEPLKGPESFVLPKGKWEFEETLEETAVREVLEETGVWAKIKDRNLYCDVVYKPKGQKSKIAVRYFLMEYLRDATSKEKKEVKAENRAISWEKRKKTISELKNLKEAQGVVKALSK